VPGRSLPGGGGGVGLGVRLPFRLVGVGGEASYLNSPIHLLISCFLSIFVRCNKYKLDKFSK